MQLPQTTGPPSITLESTMMSSTIVFMINLGWELHPGLLVLEGSFKNFEMFFCKTDEVRNWKEGVRTLFRVWPHPPTVLAMALLFT
jgi:hypothetical protein